MPAAPLMRVISVAAALTVVVGTGVAWGKIRSFESGINHVNPIALGEGGEDGAIDILLVGMDSRTDAHGNPLSEEELATLRAGDDVSTNTDTIILVRIPNNGTSATAISIPRDSYVEAPGIGKMKINGVYGSVHLEKMQELVEQQGEDPSVAEPEATADGREELIKTVANLTGVTVDHYAEIGLLGFALITDALGGVNVCLNAPVYEPLSGADFPAGWQKLDGPQALSFVRQRHDLPRGDLDRVTRQQAVMASLAHEVISSKTLSSPGTLNRLEQAVQRSVVLSDGWDIMDFVEQLQKLAAGNVAFATIPIVEEAGWSDDGMQSVVRVDPSEVKDWVHRPAGRPGRGQDRGAGLQPRQDHRRGHQRQRHQRPGRGGLPCPVGQGLHAGQRRQQRRRQGDAQPGPGRQGRRPGRAGGGQGARRSAGRRGHLGAAGFGARGAGRRLHRPRRRAGRQRRHADGRRPHRGGCDVRHRRDAARAVADHHGGLQRSRVRQLT